MIIRIEDSKSKECLALFSRIKLQTPVWRCSGSPEGSSYACSLKMPPAPAGGVSLLLFDPAVSDLFEVIDSLINFANLSRVKLK